MFGRTRRPNSNDNSDAMTAMVDVTFLLLIFFVVTASFQLQKAIAVPQQQTDAPTPIPDDAETSNAEVHVDANGAFRVISRDWEAETPGKQNLISRLKQVLFQHRSTSHTEPITLIIKVHQSAKIQSLVDAMDAATIAGFSELQVTQVDEF